MEFFSHLMTRLRAGPRRHIVLAEGDDARVQAGARMAMKEGVVDITLLTQHPQLEGRKDGIGTICPAISPRLEAYATTCYHKRKAKGMTLEEARRTVPLPLIFAAMMVDGSEADGMIAGACHPTADVVRAALHYIGPAPDCPLVSSFFIMVMDKEHPYAKAGGQQTLIFADCALVVEPNAEQRAHIARLAAANAQSLLGLQPRIAMLSFSTKSSATHPKVTHVTDTVDHLNRMAPRLCVDGDIQLDAALFPSIAERKAPDSPLAGQANVLIFPDLNAGNIGYKIAERLAGLSAIGPVFQGLAKPANDLSRACSAEDVYRLIMITASQKADS